MVSTRWKNESSFDCTRRAGEKRTGRKEETGGNVSEFGFKPAAFVACGARAVRFALIGAKVEAKVEESGALRLRYRTINERA